MAAEAIRQRRSRQNREALRPGRAAGDSLIAELEEEVERRSGAVPPGLLVRVRAFLDGARISTGHGFPPRRRPALVLDQVFEAASLMHDGGGDDDPWTPDSAA